MKKIIFLSLLCCASTAFSQHCISVEELISNYAKKGDVDNLKKYDMICNFEESREKGIFMESSLFPPDLLRPENIRAEWCFEYNSSLKGMLYLKKMYASKEGVTDEVSKYEFELIEKYGKNHLGIPAAWYTGNITVLSCPKNLFGEVVTKSVTEFKIEKGVVVSWTFLDIAKTGTMEGVRKPRLGVKYSPISDTDGCWYSSLMYKLDLVEEFVNNGFKKNTSRQKEFGLDLLLVTDKQGKVTAHILSSTKKMNKEKRALSIQLVNRIGELPLWSIGWLQTINGSIFPGRYIKALYSSDTGWKFEDYLH